MICSVDLISNILVYRLDRRTATYVPRVRETRVQITGRPNLIQRCKRFATAVAKPDRNTPMIGPGGTTLEFTATEFTTRREAQKYRLFRRYFGSR